MSIRTLVMLFLCTTLATVSSLSFAKTEPVIPEISSRVELPILATQEETSPTPVVSQADFLGKFSEKIANVSCDEIVRWLWRPLPPSIAASPEALQIVRVTQTFAVISRCALKEKTKEDLYLGQLRGMVSEVGDPHSSFLSPEEYDALKESIIGEFFGIGVELDAEIQGGKFVGVKIIAPIPDSPAERAGIRAGDRLFEINGKKVVSYKNLYEVTRDVVGPLGSTVTLTVLREGEDTPLTFAIRRAKITPQFTKTSMLQNGWAWIQVRQFSGVDICMKIESSYKQLAKTDVIKGVILDLRNNPGGKLELTYCMVELFAPKSLRGKLMLAAEYRDTSEVLAAIQTPMHIQGDKPLVVLVNGGSASASEIVAKSLQGLNVGTVVGTRTFGKGSIQSVLPIADQKMAIKLTIAQYLVYHSSGVLMPVQGVGVTPNIVLVQKKDVEMFIMHEEDFAGSIATNTTARDIPPVNTKAVNPRLYQLIMDALKDPELKVEFE